MALTRTFGTVTSSRFTISGTESAMQNLSIGYKKFFVRNVVIITTGNPGPYGESSLALRIYDKDTKGATWGDWNFRALYYIPMGTFQSDQGIFTTFRELADFLYIDKDATSTELHFTLLNGSGSSVGAFVRINYETDIDMA